MQGKETALGLMGLYNTLPNSFLDTCFVIIIPTLVDALPAMSAVTICQLLNSFNETMKPSHSRPYRKQTLF